MAVDVSEESFAVEVLERSRQLPVVLDFWASWCAPCRQLSPVLERLAAEGGGSWVLAKVDCDANPRLAAAAGVQGIPAVKAVVDGAVVSEFTGALPEPQVRSWLAQVLAVAAGDGADPGQAPADPAYGQAQEALDRGDLDAAVAAFRSILDRAPGDPVARSSLARCELLVRSRGADERVVRRRAADRPGDLDAQLAVADLDMLHGAVDDALGRLLDLVRRGAGEDRERARRHLLDLFEVLDPQDPRLAAGRRALASALF